MRAKRPPLPLMADALGWMHGQHGENVGRFAHADEAQFAVAAINAHDKLIAALNDVLSHACLHPRDFDGEARAAINRANALLEGMPTVAKGEQP